ncbi:MAG: sigma 54-interacting transcriptional regulator [Desulfobacterales bacterium]|nr:sigma 54-interacting transcriptional regulator [Desulfobacterales bacterium]
MMTAHGTVDKAVEAMQKGAYNYIAEALRQRAADRCTSRRPWRPSRWCKENRRLRACGRIAIPASATSSARASPCGTCSRPSRRSRPRNATVLIEGESGTGKELVAKPIHFNSPRRDNPFVAVNCVGPGREPARKRALRPREGRLHRRRSRSKTGRFELAHGGTLFLDEIGELSAESAGQAAAGAAGTSRSSASAASRPIAVDIRVIAATNKDLRARDRDGPFPGGSLLPPERGPHRHPAAAGPARGHPRCWSTISSRSTPATENRRYR